MKIRHLCVFAGSSPGASSAYHEVATRLSAVLADRGVGLVYGGASVGLMGVVADEMLARGGKVIGVIPQRLVDCEVAHEGLTEQRIVTSMHERKAVMSNLSDGVIALPGGFGTLDELFESLTWTQLGLQSTPVGLLNVDGYFDYLLGFLDTAVEQRFLSSSSRELLLCDADPGSLIDRLENFQAPSAEKWLDRKKVH